MDFLFKSVLFRFHTFVNVFLLLLTYSFIPPWAEKVVDMILVFLNLLRKLSCDLTCDFSWRMFCVLEKNFYFAALGWNTLYMSDRSI